MKGCPLEKIEEEHALQTYQYPLLCRLGVMHAVFTRNGGESVNEFASLNLGENTKDKKINVARNLEITNRFFLEKLQNRNKSFIGSARLIQEHGLRIQEVEKPGMYVGDALVTQTKNLALMVRHADCQAAICYDQKNQALAVIHAGWRAQTRFFYTHVAEFMKKRFGTNPQNLLIAISPSLGPDHSEFIHYKKEFPEKLHKYLVKNNHLDLWQMALDEWLSCGVPKNQIQLSYLCTFEKEEDFFSHRRSKETGRNATMALIC